MNLTEKVAYLKGLAEGLSLDDNKEGKLLKAIIDVLDEMAATVDDMDDEIGAISEEIELLDEDLNSLEEDYYDLDEDDDDFFYEVECPECGKTVYLDGDLLDGDMVECPDCQEQFEVEIDDECCCDDEDCDCCSEEE